MACVLSLMACNIKEVSHALLIMDALIFNVNFVVDRIDLTYLHSRLSVPFCGNKGRYCMLTSKMCVCACVWLSLCACVCVCLLCTYVYVFVVYASVCLCVAALRIYLASSFKFIFPWKCDGQKANKL